MAQRAQRNVSGQAGAVVLHAGHALDRLLCLCSAYVQGGLTKAFDFRSALDEMKQVGLRPPAPLAVAVIAMEIGASVLVLSGFLRWAGVLMLGGSPCSQPLWQAPLPKRYATENLFLEHLDLVGGFIWVAWYDLQR